MKRILVMSHILRMATVTAILAVATTGVAQAHGLAKIHKQAGYAAPLSVVNPTTAPQFIRVGPNGYWVTTTWGCWVDDGQGRIHDCDGQ
jgi:hypothetical protein